MNSYSEQFQDEKAFHEYFNMRISMQQFLHKAKLFNYLFIVYKNDSIFCVENRQVLLGKTHTFHWLMSKNLDNFKVREDLKKLEKPIEFLSAFIKNTEDDIGVENMPKDIVLLAPNAFIETYKNQVLKVKKDAKPESDVYALMKKNENISVVHSPIQDHLILTSLSNLKGEEALFLEEKNGLLCHHPKAVFHTKLP